MIARRLVCGIPGELPERRVFRQAARRSVAPLRGGAQAQVGRAFDDEQAHRPHAPGAGR